MTTHDAPEQPIYPELRRAAEAFFPGASDLAPVPNAPHLARVERDDGTFLVRRWPDGTTADRIDASGAALALAHDSAVTIVPRMLRLPGGDGRFALHGDGHLCSASTWLQGRPLARYGHFRDPDGRTIDVPLPPSGTAPEVVLDAVRTLARVHEATGSIARDTPLPSFTPGMRLSETRLAWARQRRTIGRHAAEVPEIRRWLRCGNRVVPAAEARLATLGSRDARSVVVHGDLWPVHLLVEAGALTGIVGWSWMAAGSPVLDLAQLAVHTSGWSAATAETILGAYAEIAPLAPEERRSLPVVAALDLLPRVGTMLQLAFIEDRPLADEAVPVLRSGLRTLLGSLEELTAVLAPEAERATRPGGERTGGRVWDRSRPAPARSRRESRRSGSGRSRPGSRPGRPPGR